MNNLSRSNNITGMKTDRSTRVKVAGCLEKVYYLSIIDVIKSKIDYLIAMIDENRDLKSIRKCFLGIMEIMNWISCHVATHGGRK